MVEFQTFVTTSVRTRMNFDSGLMKSMDVVAKNVWKTLIDKSATWLLFHRHRFPNLRIFYEDVFDIFPRRVQDSRRWHATIMEAVSVRARVWFHRYPLSDHSKKP